MPCSTSGNAEDRRGNPSHQARPEGCITSVAMVPRTGGGAFGSPPSLSRGKYDGS